MTDAGPFFGDRRDPERSDARVAARRSSDDERHRGSADADDLEAVSEDGTLRPILTELRRSIGELSMSIRSLEARISGETG